MEVKKKERAKKLIKEKKSENISTPGIQKLLVENFIGLQKAMTNLAIRFESLSSQINSLLEVFELSAKSFIGQGNTSSEENKDMINKINALLEQNKTLAKGLVTLEEKLKQKNQMNISQQFQRRI